MYIFTIAVIIALTCFLLMLIKKSAKNATRKKILNNVLMPVTGGSKKCAKEIYSLLCSKGKFDVRDKVFAALDKYTANDVNIDFYAALLCEVYKIAA